ncbi:16S rRNA (guanine(966)-N(2))-methyltransferase RsmD [Agrococcus sp. SGAir0287]|uniref:16S rRNA (guanine(966)-N(2))-methyltransferase RsmD n=1 Tax=Agrococcus sp. SGAir0287 TaxID=2070347 RepID=UPI0010CD001C|nr:16S rRNA (guanine(966)-N(2))-methyltransferase RsmD [Agrococcus sp. SGAir0287]QCR19766.1 16S rRNA (guanine(966)-N(2))-methyltransferase RsmD [Agrococcus sp. SGAir0287]
MTRIIAGVAGSLTLAVPGAGTRPTSDRMRESIFSALDARGLCDGAHVLDLFAGSGALGLEAASRGAASVVLVDSARQAAKVAQRNADAVAKAGAERATVVAQPALAYLAQTTRTFDLVFLDPPYDLPPAQVAAVLQALVPTLVEDAVVVLEQASRAGEPEPPSDLALVRTRRHGDTAVHWLERRPGAAG